MSAQTTSTSQARHLETRISETDSRFSRIYRGMLASAGFAAFVLVSAPALALTTAPPLGTTSTYGIVSGTTTVITTATVNGNVCYTGTAVGLTVNSGTALVPCGSQIGDQATALSDLTGKAGCIALNTPATLNGDTSGGVAGTFAPNCYTSATALGIAANGIVTLNGPGVYIFRSTGGGITTLAGASIQYAGGANASNTDVYWTGTGATTLGATNTFIGTIIDTAGISIGNGSTLAGRALAAGSTVTIDTSTITVPAPPPPPPAPVPTLSQWAMITFALLIAGFGLQMMRRRRQA